MMIMAMQKMTGMIIWMNRVNYSIHLYDKYIRRLSSESAKTIEYIMKRNLLMIQMDDAFFIYLIYLFTHSRRNG